MCSSGDADFQCRIIIIFIWMHDAAKKETNEQPIDRIEIRHKNWFVRFILWLLKLEAGLWLNSERPLCCQSSVFRSAIIYIGRMPITNVIRVTFIEAQSSFIYHTSHLICLFWNAAEVFSISISGFHTIFSPSLSLSLSLLCRPTADTERVLFILYFFLPFLTKQRHRYTVV